MNADLEQRDLDSPEYWDLFVKLYQESQSNRPKNAKNVQKSQVSIQKQVDHLRKQVFELNNKLEMITKSNDEARLICGSLQQQIVGIKGEFILLKQFFEAKGFTDTDFQQWKNTFLTSKK